MAEGTSPGSFVQPWSGATSCDTLGMMSGLAFKRPVCASLSMACWMGIGPVASRSFSLARTLMSAVGGAVPTLRISSS